MPPLWRIDPANVLALALPPVIGKDRPSAPAVAGSTGAASIPSEASALAAPGSSASVVVPPANSTSAGRAFTVTEPIGSPFANRLVSNAAFSALAAWPLSTACTPLTVVPSPLRTTFAFFNDSESTVSRPLPTLAVRIARLAPTWTRKLLSATRVPPALSARPPEWSIRPAADAGSIAPPVIGKATPPP